jgi:hypothetical protein
MGRAIIDGKDQGNVAYIFRENFREVVLTLDEVILTGAKAELYVNELPYRLEQDRNSKHWKMLDSFIF